MKFKKGVKVYGVRPELLLAIMVAEKVYEKNSLEFTITSINDGKHSRNSLHPFGFAFDLRTRHIAPDRQHMIRDEIANSLTDEYDVVLEDDHIHLEYDRKE